MMPVLRVALGRLKALALGGGDVQHDGMIDIAQLLQRIDQRLDIVAGVQVTIVEPQRAENVALAGAVAGAQLGQIAIQTTVVFGNGLVVIVDDNDQVAVEIGGIVKASNARPPESEPSPITVMTLYVSPARSRAWARPQPKLTEVEV